MTWTNVPRVPAVCMLWLRATWVVIQVVAAIWMAHSGLQFYYQGF